MSLLDQVRSGYRIAKREMFLDTRMKSLLHATQSGVAKQGAMECLIAEIEAEKRTLQKPRTIAEEVGYAIGTYFDYR